MNKLHINFINKVIKMAADNVIKNTGGPFAAIIVKNNKMVSCGYNCVTSKNDPTMHAEIDAVRKAAKKLKTFDLSSCTLYSSCEPCPMCLSAVYWANIKEIYYAAGRDTASKYGFIDVKIYDELKTNITSVKLTAVESENSNVPFEVWKNKTDKIIY